MSYLLDTCVLSEVVKPEPEARVLEWLDQERICFLSSLTLGELRKGIEVAPDGLKKRRLETWFSDKILPEFAQRILNVDLEVALVWGKLHAELRGSGVRLPVIDGLLAATALHHRLTLVTRNEKDFVATDVPLINPWS